MRISTRSVSVLLLALALTAAATRPAGADCPDIPYTCAFGAIFMRGTCWEFPKTCVPCGNTDCPSYARSYDQVAHKIDTNRCPQAIERKDGCSLPKWMKDPATNAYKELLKAACDQHDVCYSTLASGKVDCDQNLRRNTESICRGYYKGALNSVQLGNCLAAVGVWFSSVYLAAQSDYDSNQDWALKNCQPALAKSRLRGKASGRVACIAGAGKSNGEPMHLYDYVGLPDQQWAFEDAGEGYSYLKVQHTQKCLDLSNGTPDDGGRLQQWDCDHGTDNQKWKVERQGDGTIVLKSKASGKCMASPSGTANFTAVVQESCSGSDNQRWYLDAV